MNAEEIKKIAYLSRLHIENNELESFLEEFNIFLKIFKQLQAVNTDNIASITHPINLVYNMQQPLRIDIVTEIHQHDEYFNNAPLYLNRFFLVPKVIE